MHSATGQPTAGSTNGHIATTPASGSRDEKKGRVMARVLPNYDPAPLQTDLVQRQGHVKVDMNAKLLRMLNVSHADQAFTAEYLIFAEVGLFVLFFFPAFELPSNSHRILCPTIVLIELV